MNEMVERALSSVENPSDRAAKVVILLLLEEAGLVIVPREPTEAMIAGAMADPVTAAVDGLVAMAASHGVALSDFYRGDNLPLKRWWRAMIDVASDKAV